MMFTIAIIIVIIGLNLQKKRILLYFQKDLSL